MLIFKPVLESFLLLKRWIVSAKRDTTMMEEKANMDNYTCENYTASN